MDNKIAIALAGIASLTTLEVCALACGLDGQVFASVVVAIAGIVAGALGYAVGSQKKAK